jgi:Family of unknown function (DUF5343)
MAQARYHSKGAKMAGTLPYVNQPGSIVKILEKVKDAKTPDRFTQDFLETKLGFRGGNYRQFIPFAKKMGLLNSDGTPTDLYKRYRNSHTSRAAIARALKTAYRELFERNEYANSLNKEQFKGLVVEITGLEPKNRIVQLICQTFELLKAISDFEAKLPEGADDVPGDRPDDISEKEKSTDREKTQDFQDFDLNLSYTINLVLPKTDDPAVFNAIFRSLRENLLKR